MITLQVEQRETIKVALKNGDEHADGNFVLDHALHAKVRQHYWHRQVQPDDSKRRATSRQPRENSNAGQRRDLNIQLVPVFAADFRQTKSLQSAFTPVPSDAVA